MPEHHRRAAAAISNSAGQQLDASVQQRPEQHEGPAVPLSVADAAPAAARGAAAIYSGLVTKRRLTSQRDRCTTCCQLLFPVRTRTLTLALTLTLTPTR